MNKLQRTLVAAVGVAATPLAMANAPPAQADTQQDYTFYSTLTDLGFDMWNPPAMRVQGWQTCNDLAVGHNWRFTMTKLMNIGYDLDEASMIFAAAVTAYCPWEDPRSFDDGD